MSLSNVGHDRTVTRDLNLKNILRMRNMKDMRIGYSFRYSSKVLQSPSSRLHRPIVDDGPAFGQAIRIRMGGFDYSR